MAVLATCNRSTRCLHIGTPRPMRLRGPRSMAGLLARGSLSDACLPGFPVARNGMDLPLTVAGAAADSGRRPLLRSLFDPVAGNHQRESVMARALIRQPASGRRVKKATRREPDSGLAEGTSAKSPFLATLISVRGTRGSRLRSAPHQRKWRRRRSACGAIARRYDENNTP
jgi:hypothetical protein